jgi:beta-glucosidase-like glycosyl hydrolase
MTAHILYPKLDPVYPATASRFILEEILKNKLRFQGVVISDALEMKALSDRFDIAKLAVQIINAGCDMLIYSENMPADIAFETVYQTVLDATRSGDISKNRLTDAVKKILMMKKRVFSSPEEKTDTSRFLHDHTFLFRVLQLAFQTNEDAHHFPVNVGEKKVVVVSDHPGWRNRLKSASFVRDSYFLETIAKKQPVIDGNTDEIWLFIDNPEAVPQPDKLHLPKQAKVRLFSLNDPGLKNKTGIKYDSYINLYGDKLPINAILELVSKRKT